jgi:hypothetical protein
MEKILLANNCYLEPILPTTPSSLPSSPSQPKTLAQWWDPCLAVAPLFRPDPATSRSPLPSPGPDPVAEPRIGRQRQGGGSDDGLGARGGGVRIQMLVA